MPLCSLLLNGVAFHLCWNVVLFINTLQFYFTFKAIVVQG